MAGDRTTVPMAFSFDDEALRKIVQHEIETFVQAEQKPGGRLHSERIQYLEAHIVEMQTRAEKDAKLIANQARNIKALQEALYELTEALGEPLGEALEQRTAQKQT